MIICILSILNFLEDQGGIFCSMFNNVLWPKRQMKQFFNCCSSKVFLLKKIITSVAIFPKTGYLSLQYCSPPKFKEKVQFKFFLTIFFFSVFLKLSQDMSYRFLEFYYTVKGDLCQKQNTRMWCFVLANSWIFIISSELIDTVEKRCKQYFSNHCDMKRSFLFLQSNGYCIYPSPKLWSCLNFRSLFLCGLHSCVALVAKALKLKANREVLIQRRLTERVA